MVSVRRFLAALTAAVMLAVSGTPTLAGPKPAPTNGYWEPNNPAFAQVVPRIYGASQLPELNGYGQTIGIIGIYHDYAEDAKADLAKAIEVLDLAPMYGLPGTEPCTIENGPWPCFEVKLVESDPRKPPLFAGSCSIYYEMALDVQAAHKMAPGANIRLYLGETPDVFDLFYTLRRALEDDVLSVISLSFSTSEENILTNPYLGEEFLREYSEVLDRAKTLIVAASGDWGDRLEFPSTHPNVLAVGGTTFKQEDRSFTPWNPESERAWSTYEPGHLVGSAGGPSMVFARPSYQDGFHDLPFRTTPDIALNADGQPTFTSNHWIDAGATSVAAPMIAGVIARANQARTQMGLPKISHPAEIYALATGEGYRENFRDITQGLGACVSETCAAGPGYDFATGLGVPRIERFVPNAAGMTPIDIADLTVSAVTEESIQISFTTNVPTEGFICYTNAPERDNLALPLGSGMNKVCVSDGQFGTRHTVTISGLADNTRYSIWAGAKSAEYTRHVEVGNITTRPRLTEVGLTAADAVELEDGKTYHQMLEPHQNHYYRFSLNEGDKVDFRRTTTGQITFYLQDAETGKLVDLIGPSKHFDKPGSYIIRVSSYSDPVQYSLKADFTRADEVVPEPEPPTPTVPHYSLETALVLEDGKTYTYSIGQGESHYYKFETKPGDMLIFKRSGTGPITVYLMNARTGKILDTMGTLKSVKFEGAGTYAFWFVGNPTRPEYTFSVRFTHSGDKTEGIVMTVPADPESTAPIAEPDTDTPDEELAPPEAESVEVPEQDDSDSAVEPIVVTPIERPIPARGVEKSTALDLEFGKTYQVRMRAGETHSYRFVAQKGDTAGFTVSSDAPVSLYLLDASGRLLADVGANRIYAFTAEGEYKLQVVADQPLTYTLRVDIVRPAPKPVPPVKQLLPNPSDNLIPKPTPITR
ncbi:conserved domain protein [Symbiobacterium thermophilum IAM 14863]|uniref:Conserved domain protein n=1 Tax=Symbiobacterium thermophilum (strain DSM 24528 / JCM 14929 / IAM 14863 / T) TaxID=292459 RepID=Q67M40_SYMTH|nr:conserved domain protein [Symbiobacterium thermophilum IAM 14863]